MSLCLILQNKNKIYVGTDTALSVKNQNNFLRINKGIDKIFEFSNGIMFCSGNMFYVKKTMEFIEESNLINVERISSFLKKENFRHEKDIFQIEIVCFIFGEHPRIYQISQYNNFNIIEHEYDENLINIFACGFKTESCLNIAEKEIKKNTIIEDIFKNTFDSLVCEQIGGNLNIWEVGYNANKIFANKINDDFISKYDIESSSFYSLVADVLVGRIIAGNQLTIENSNNTFSVNESGATLTNANFTINSTNNLSKIILNPNDGIKIQTNISGTWTDKFYVDSSGNLVLVGKLTANKGTIGGWNINATQIYSSNGEIVLDSSYPYVQLGALTITENSFNAVDSATNGSRFKIDANNGYLTANGALISSATLGNCTISGSLSVGSGVIIGGAGNTTSMILVGGVYANATLAVANSFYVNPYLGSDPRITMGGGRLYVGGNLTVQGSLDMADNSFTANTVNSLFNYYINGVRGKSGSIYYLKSGGGSGVLSFISGIITAYS
jgi:hypothetical protein